MEADDAEGAVITEAIEAAYSKEAALYNLAAQYAKDETVGVRDMYESAAVAYGASFDETDRAAEIGRLARAYALDVKARQAAGDTHAEYHAQRPKVRAYRLLLAGGFFTIDPTWPGYNVKLAVSTFAMLTREVSS